MYSKFLENIHKKNLIGDGDRVLACVSGGADSMSMLDALIRYLDGDKSRLEVAHFDHQLRGEDSKRDANFVREFCQTKGLKFHLRSMDIGELAGKEKISIEEAGRKYRYKFFYDVVGLRPNFKIALAHNLDDQAETVLMRIIRGTGIDGLSGIQEEDGIIIRPLLTISRKEIEAYILDNDLKFVQDHTNFENDYTRNKLRNEVIPMVEEKINPAFKDSLLRLSDHARDEKKIRDEYISELFHEILSKEEKFSISLSRGKFEKKEDYLQKELLRQAILRLRGHLTGFDHKHYEEFLNLRKSKSGKEIVINDISVSTTSKYLLIKSINYNPLEQDIDIQGVNRVNINGYLIEYDLKDKKALLRKRRNGDRILFRGKEKKLKDFFIDKKIDLVDRDYYPIIEIGGRIVSVADIYLDRQLIDELGIKLKIKGGLLYGYFALK
ncbi:MAG: tRNA lysidine(34) synthetase TilS [Tissierellia bacterium]|nr:tRNA lysidine(34) synthetase TilS [Tissierellia bacterium]